MLMYVDSVDDFLSCWDGKNFDILNYMDYIVYFMFGFVIFVVVDVVCFVSYLVKILQVYYEVSGCCCGFDVWFMLML